ncbi:MAG: iron-sulfur cluster carrier protein ApbC [Sumerlaeia bacterium]
MPVTKEAVTKALSTVQDPDLHQDLVTLGMVKSISVDANNVTAVIELTTPACPMKKKIEDDCRNAISQISGIGEIKIEMTANVRGASIPDGKTAIPGVKNIIAVSSGKGGVGKSTTAVNLSIALNRLGARVALLDADIYGPNIPGMMGQSGRPKVIEKRIIPLESQGIHIMSMGFLVSEEQPLVWRGPMLHGVMKQLLRDVSWGDQDYLVIDLPPGTGDIQLTLSQLVPITGAVIVTTPQNVALQDVKKGIGMFRQVDVPILGVVENMSYYLCPKCGNRDEIFSHGGGEAQAELINEQFFGHIPLNGELRRCMDAGLPPAGNPDSEFFAIYRALAEKVAQQVAILNSKNGPKPFAVIRANS